MCLKTGMRYKFCVSPFPPLFFPSIKPAELANNLISNHNLRALTKNQHHQIKWNTQKMLWCTFTIDCFCCKCFKCWLIIRMRAKDAIMKSQSACQQLYRSWQSTKIYKKSINSTSHCAMALLLVCFCFCFALSMCCRLDTHLNDIWFEMHRHRHIPDWELTVLVGRLLHILLLQWSAKICDCNRNRNCFWTFYQKEMRRERVRECMSALKRDVHRSPCRTTEEISSYAIVDFAVYNLFSFYFFGCWFNQCTQVVWDSININCIGDIAGSSEVGGRTRLVIDWCIRFCVYTQNSPNSQCGGTFSRWLLLVLLLLLLFLIFASFPFAQVARSFLTVITVAMHFFGLCFRTWHMIVLVIFSSPPFASLSHALGFLCCILLFTHQHCMQLKLE